MKGKRILIINIIASLVIILASLSTFLLTKVDKLASGIEAELLRSMNYAQITDADSNIENCDYVKFSAFFTRDLNEDGNAEKLLGTCRNVNTTDVLYMDLNILTDGYLRDGKITINGENFNYSMNMVKDSVLKNNYISDDVKEIELNQINAGTQKLILGDVLADIGNDTNNYSKVNSVTLTGTHVTDDGAETKIEKTIDLTVDWHGSIETRIYTYSAYYNYDNLESNTISIKFRLNELQQELLLKENTATIIIPELNGYAPTEVVCTNDNVQAEYNEETKLFTINRNSKINEEGIITSKLSASNTYEISVTYPEEAYNQISSYTELQFPIEGYYVGYNNKNSEFENPIKSNIVKDKVTVIFRETPVTGYIYNFDVKLADKKYVSKPNGRYVISKQDLLNLYDNEEYNGKFEYTVKWYAFRGTQGEVSSIVMNETNEKQEEIYGDKFDEIVIQEYTTNTGIYFEGQDQMLGENGTISVYNNDTNELIKTFTKEDWNIYSASNPYKYETKVKHIRVETSQSALDSTLTVSNIKELDANKIIQDYTKEQIKDVEIIYTYLTGTANIVGQDAGIVNDLDYAYYVSETSYAKIAIEQNKIPTQETYNNQKIYVSAEEAQIGDSKWKNGEFLVEIPEEIINMEINTVTIDNESVKIVAYDLFQKDGKYFVKIITENEELSTYKITIDCNITANPKTATTNKEIKLYAYNQYCNDYYYDIQDTYDVDSDNNTKEQVGTSSTNLNLLSPTSLITLETVSNYNEENQITIAPNVAFVEKETRQATINIELTNNYPNTVSGVQILGKIPFEGNTYILNGKDLKSRFTATMSNQGIVLPEELKETAVVYYSVNTNPSKDLTNSENGWTLRENVEDFSQIKTYLIDLKQNIIAVGKSYTFNYVVDLPNNINYNLASYSNHAIYYELNTEGGNLQLSTEPNRVGIRIVKEFDLQITKYKMNSSLAIPGVTYILKYEEENVDGELEEKTRILTTNNEGKIVLDDLHGEKEYTLQEFRVPDTCELNAEEIKFTVNADGTVIMNGNVRNHNFEKTEILQLELEDEVKYDVEINKTKAGGSLGIDGVRFKLEDAEGNTEYLRTQNGKALFVGLSLNKEYTLTETAAPATCEVNQGIFKFKLVRVNGVVTLQTITNTLALGTPVVQDLENKLTPVLNLNVQNEIKYVLDLTKQDEEGNKLKDVQFNIKGEGFSEQGTKFTTTQEGKIFVYGLSLGKSYTLEEIKADGYYLDLNKNNTIEFKVDRTADGLKVKTWSIGDGILQVGTANVLEKDLNATVSVVLENEKIPTYNLKLVKVNEDGEKLQGAQFKLTSIDTNTEQTLMTGENGECIFENLYEYIEGKCVEGEYVLEETFAPEGYAVDTTKLKFKSTRDANGKVQIEILEGDKIVKENTETSEKEIVSDENTITLNILNKPIFTLKKYGDKNTLLPNAKFEITDLDGNYVTDINGEIVGTDETIDGQNYKVVTTDEKGEIALGLPEGMYKGIEIKAPQYYQITEMEEDRIHYFGIGKSKPEEEKYQFAWAKSVKSELASELEDVLPTEDGGAIAVGKTSTDIDENGDEIVDKPGKGDKDGIIIKYDKDGNIEWSKILGGTNYDELYSIAKNPYGGYLIAGSTDSTELYSDSTLVDTEYFGNVDGILIKIDDNGNYIWSQSIGGTGIDRINSVAVSESGDIAVTGSYTSTEINLDKVQTDTLTNLGAASKKNAFITVYSNNGEYKWSQNIGGTEDTTGASIVSTNSGFVVAVNFIGTAYLDTAKTTSIKANGKADGVVIAYNGDGNVSWNKQIGSTENETLYEVASDKDGNIIVVGAYGAEVDLNVDGTNDLTTKGNYDGMVVKLNESRRIFSA